MDFLGLFFKGWSLKYNLMIRLIFLILVMGTVLTSFSFTMQYNEGRSSRYMMMNLISNNINDLLLDLLAEIETDAEVYRGLLAKISIDNIASRNQARVFISNNLKANKYMDGFSLTESKTGHMIRTMKNREGKLLVAETIPGENGIFHSTLYENRGTPEQKIILADSNENDPRHFDFYLAFKDGTKKAWYNSRGYSQNVLHGYPPILSYIVPLKDDFGALLGMLTLDIGVLQLQKYLMDITNKKMDRDYSFGGIPFVLERRNNNEIVVIGHPDPIYIEKVPDPSIVSDSNKFLILANKHPDQRIRAFTKIIEKEYKEDRDPFNENSMGINTVKADDNSRWMYSWTATYPGQKPDWVIGVCVNRELAAASVITSLQNTLLVLTILVIATGFVAIKQSRIMSKPLERMAKDVISIGEGNIVLSSEKSILVKEMIDLKEGIEKMKSGLLSFRKYIPYKVVNQVLASRKTAEPFAEKKELSIFFSDLENFTTISESLEPDKLVKMIGDHLAMCTNVIQALEGTVDKYIGDSVMAFWNAPEDCKGHELKACHAALACQEQMVLFNGRNKAEGLPELKMRIGISTGTVFVGNIGSEDRLNYTAVGDTVNLASRLEGTNKTYKTLILISDRTESGVRGQILTRPVDKVAVKGKANAIIIHEVLAKKENETPQLRKMIDLTTQAFEHYLSQRFEQAMDCYQQILAVNDDDHVAMFYVKRCRGYLDFPPPSDWDGTFISESK
ncbi:MAG: adenylate/guanylate cyclase domain-containing protein [Planctomycetes bacterium]|nr:adenylate/guanylate cyclase domain-containing protein [Planctomycetota bacterium]